MSSPEEELKARLAKAKGEFSAFEKKQEDDAPLRALQAEVQAAERRTKDAAAIAVVEEKHGPIDGKKFSRLDTDQGVIVVKRPNHLHYQRFRDAGEVKTADLIKLVTPCLVHPDKVGFETMIEEQPGILDRTANLVVTLAGFSAKEASGK